MFFIFAVPGLISSLLWFRLVRDEPRGSRYVSQREVDYIKSSPPADQAKEGKRTVKPVEHSWVDRLIRARLVQLLSTHRSVLTSWNVWGCALGYFFLVGITYAIMTWVPTYLVSVKHFSMVKMGAVASSPWVGAIVGNLLGGWLSDTVFARRRKPVMLITSAATVGMMYALLSAPDDPTLLPFMFFNAGIFLNLGFATFLVYPMSIATREMVPHAASIVSTGGSLGGAFAPLFVGLILDKSGWPAVFAFLATRSAATFVLVLSIIEPRTATPDADEATVKEGARPDCKQLVERNA